jgi:hypothetical protein
LARSKTLPDVSYRALTPPWVPALDLFRFAGAWAPLPESLVVGWGAWDGERLCGALLAERAGASAMLHGPVVVAPPEAPPEVGIEVADHLVAEALSHAQATGIETFFTRPQGLDRIWIRFGFIPVPEVELPPALRERPGIGLYGWRGGTALWSAAGRGASRSRPVPAR